jgi:hypothetical protein
MFKPAPIDKDFVPYTKRPVLRRNAGLFVDGARGRGRGGARVLPQQSALLNFQECVGKPAGVPCGYWNGVPHGTCDGHGGCG